MSKNFWVEIWGKRGDKIKEFDLIKLDGFDTTTSNFGQEHVNQLISLIINKLNLNEKSSLIDFGCGAGMTFIPLSKVVRKISGVDFSESLIRRLKEYNEKFDISVAEVNNVPYNDNLFDKVLSHSVFHYFPSLEYAQNVISEMVRVLKPDGSILIMDILDYNKKEEYTSYRRGLDDIHYDPNFHLFFRKAFFKHQAKKYNFKIETFPLQISTYLSDKYRFNVLFESK